MAVKEYPILMYRYDAEGELKAIALVDNPEHEQSLLDQGFVYDKRF